MRGTKIAINIIAIVEIIAALLWLVINIIMYNGITTYEENKGLETSSGATGLFLFIVIAMILYIVSSALAIAFTESGKGAMTAVCVINFLFGNLAIAILYVVRVNLLSNRVSNIRRSYSIDDEPYEENDIVYDYTKDSQVSGSSYYNEDNNNF